MLRVCSWLKTNEKCFCFFTECRRWLPMLPQEGRLVSQVSIVYVCMFVCVCVGGVYVCGCLYVYLCVRVCVCKNLQGRRIRNCCHLFIFLFIIIFFFVFYVSSSYWSRSKSLGTVLLVSIAHCIAYCIAYHLGGILLGLALVGSVSPRGERTMLHPGHAGAPRYPRHAVSQMVFKVTAHAPISQTFGDPSRDWVITKPCGCAQAWAHWPGLPSAPPASVRCPYCDSRVYI